jgi:hypothetical protein
MFNGTINTLPPKRKRSRWLEEPDPFIYLKPKNISIETTGVVSIQYSRLFLFKVYLV